MNNIAVVGLGNISKRHRANLKALYPESYVMAVSSSGNLNDAVVENADKVISDIDELFKHELDLVIVASPATFHTSHALPCFELGIPVLIEKPVTATVKDAIKIACAANQSGTVAAVAYCLRYLDSAQRVKEIIDSGTIGDIYNVYVETGQYLPNWRQGRNYKETVSANRYLGGGVLLELSHEFDYLHWIFGGFSPHSAILRTTKELQLSVEDSADILAIGDFGVVFSIHLDFLQRKAKRTCRIIGSKGTIDWDLIANKVFINNGDSITEFDYSNVDKNKMYLEMIMDFERKIKGSNSLVATIDEALKTVQLVEKIKSVAEYRVF